MTKKQSGRVPSYDLAIVKAYAHGRWAAILAEVGGIDIDLLDGQHHPCPKCGGVDRWRFTDVDGHGSILCNQCSRHGVGDGLAALGWANGWTFVESLKRVAEWLGIQQSTTVGTGGGKVSSGARPESADPAKDLVPLAWSDGLAGLWCLTKPPIVPSAILATGGRLAKYREQYTVVDLPVIGEGLTSTVGHALYNLSGGTLPKYTRQPNGQPPKISHVKTKLTYGSQPGLIGTVDRLLSITCDMIIKLEGCTDILAMLSLADLPPNVAVITNANGAGERPAIWMLELFRGKLAITIGDADWPGVKGAVRWSRAIATVAAESRLAKLPYDVVETHGRDVRDYFRENRTYADLLTLPFEVMAATPEVNPADMPPDFDEVGTIRGIADVIQDRDFFARDPSGRLYIFSSGVYRPGAERFIRSKVKHLLSKWNESAKWSTRLADSVVAYIGVDAPELLDRPPLDLLNVVNGLLRIPDRTLLPHDPALLSTVQIPVVYDPTATCPAIETFVGEVFPADASDLAWEIPAALMLADTSIQKAVLLSGPGGNGKSTYLAAVIAFLGKSNISAVSLHKLEADTFAVARLHGKLANICADLPSEHLAGTSIFKAVTGGDPLSGERKFCDAFDFVPFARLVFSANHFPRSADSSTGFFDRWAVIPFDRSFRGEQNEIPRAELDARLSAPSELSGLLNHALDALPRLKQQRGFSMPQSVRDAWQEFHSITDPLAVWLDRYTVDSPDAYVEKKRLRIAFNAHLEQTGRPHMTDKAFGSKFARLRPGIESRQQQQNNSRQWCYCGIGLTSDLSDAHGAQDAQDYPLSSQRTEEGEGDIGVGDRGEKVQGDPVHPVHHVQSTGRCDHTNPKSWFHESGIAFCSVCNKRMGRVKP